MIGPWNREPGYRVATKSLVQIRTTAIAVREILKMNEVNIDVIQLLENKLRHIGIHFHIVEPQTIPGEAARAIPDEGKLYVTSDSYERIYEGDPDFQLLIPHEIAHFALRHSASFARTISVIPHTSMEDSEVQADRFSHEFSMPISMVEAHCRSISDIQRVFCVPKLDAQIRHDQLAREKVIDW